MLAPIVTKDMKLFPTRPLPSNIKNVRSRAQSIDQLPGSSGGGGSRGRVVPVKPRNSKSTGNLTNTPLQPPRSPPKSIAGRQPTLMAIQEGVELTCGDKENEPDGCKSIPDIIGPPCGAELKGCGNKKLKMTNSDPATNKIKEPNASMFKGGIIRERSKSERRSVVRWFAKAFRRTSGKDDEDMRDTCST